MTMDNRHANEMIFEDTRDFITKSPELRKSIARTQYYQKMISGTSEILYHGLFYSDEAKIVVSEKRTLEAASNYKGMKTCILNFASATRPGGGVLSGASAQEESICRCSTLYFCLNSPEMISNFYRPHRQSPNSFNNDDVIYSPDIQVIRSEATDSNRLGRNHWYPVNVITCAAPNLRTRSLQIPYGENRGYETTEDELRSVLIKRIRRIFSIAAAEENEVLILGAFGCGAFGNPPALVADVFYQTTQEYRHKFVAIEYAIWHPERALDNYLAFRNRFSPLIEKENKTKPMEPRDYSLYDVETKLYMVHTDKGYMAYNSHMGILSFMKEPHPRQIVRFNEDGIHSPLLQKLMADIGYPNYLKYFVEKIPVCMLKRELQYGMDAEGFEQLYHSQFT